MAQAFSALRQKVGKPLSGVLVLSLIYAIYKAKQQYKVKDTKPAAAKKKSQNQKVGVNSEFIEQMKKLLPICIPGVFSKESGLLVVLASVLIARTWLDIWFSGFNG
jgi:ATP-binding cassette subfamily D (ALD) protein 3